MILAAVPTWVSTWLTPVTLLGVGAIGALGILAVLWGIWCVIHLPSGRQAPAIVREGPLFPIFVVTCCLAIFGLIGMMFIVRKPAELMESLQRLPQTGERQYTFQIDPGLDAAQDASSVELSDIEPQKIDLDIKTKELVELRFLSDLNIDTISPFPVVITESDKASTFSLSGGEELIWLAEDKGSIQLPREKVEALYVFNLDTLPTTLQLTVVTAPVHKEVIAIPVMAAIIVFIFGIYFLSCARLPSWIMNKLPRKVQSAVQPKIAAVALATAKSEMAQPLFLICMVLGCFFLTLFVVLPYNTFGEDIKMMKDSGLTLIMILSIVVCLWAASNSISEEIEGRTALTVLSKPVGRWQFILGKFFGISWVAAVMFLLLGLWFLIAICYKPLYDARETANTDPNWQECYMEMVQTAPGLALGFFETIVLAAISVAISTRLPMLANFIICISIYVLGHLTPMMVKASIGSERIQELVVFVARLFAAAFPVLEHFDIKPAIAGGVEVPLDYLGWSLLYCILYSAVAMLLALTMFEDRDLA